MNWLSHPYFHAWHWAFQQIQLSNWFGNIVAGIVGFLAGGRKLLKDKALHAKVEHVIFHHPDIPDFPTAPNQRNTMKVLTTPYYLARKVWFSVFPRKVGGKGRAAQGEAGALPPVGALPAPPLSWSAPRRVAWGYLGNDTLGDCVFAGIAHGCMAVAHYLKRVCLFSAGEVSNWYLNWTGGQDAGAIIPAVLAKWAVDSMTSTPFYGYGVGGPFCTLVQRYDTPAGPAAPMNSAQLDLIKSCIANFGVVVVGAELQQAQETQFERGQMWDFVPGSKTVGGHCVVLIGYNSVGPMIVSWGKMFRATWAWVANVVDEAYTGVFPAINAAGHYVAPLVTLDQYVSEEPPAR